MLSFVKRPCEELETTFGGSGCRNSHLPLPNAVLLDDDDVAVLLLCAGQEGPQLVMLAPAMMVHSGSEAVADQMGPGLGGVLAMSLPCRAASLCGTLGASSGEAGGSRIGKPSSSLLLRRL